MISYQHREHGADHSVAGTSAARFRSTPIAGRSNVHHVGSTYAVMSLLATIYQRYHPELTLGIGLDPTMTVTARPKHEIPMTVHRR